MSSRRPRAGAANGTRSRGNAFALRSRRFFAHVKNNCTDQTLLQTMGMLEIELAARAQEDDEERRKRGQTHHAANPAMGATPGKASRRRRKEQEKERVKDQETNQSALTT